MAGKVSHERLRPTLGFLLPFPLGGVLGLRKGVHRLWNLDRLRWRRPTGRGWLIVIAGFPHRLTEEGLRCATPLLLFPASISQALSLSEVRKRPSGQTKSGFDSD